VGKAFRTIRRFCGSLPTIATRPSGFGAMTGTRAPDANAHAERWVGSVRRECLDRLLIFSIRQLEHVLRVYVGHYNRHRPHRALDLRAPDQISAPASRSDPVASAAAIRRRDLLGGLIHEYEATAA